MNMGSLCHKPLALERKELPVHAVGGESVSWGTAVLNSRNQGKAEGDKQMLVALVLL